MSNESAQNIELPPMPANALTDSAARHAHFAATVAAFEKAEKAASAAPASNQPAASAANESTLATLERVGKIKIPGTDKFAKLDSSQFRAAHEGLVARALSGEKIPDSVIDRELQKALGLPFHPEAPAPGEPVEPQGMPHEREQARLDALADRLDAGEPVEWNQLPKAAFSGYEVNLPSDFFMSGHDISMLETARAANLPQSVIDEFVAARIAAESAA